MERNMMKRSSLMLLVAMIALLMSCGISFADETGSTVAIHITSGEHGTINGQTGSFTETVTSGNDLVLECKADEGYVIESVTVNNAEVEYADLSGILNKNSGKLTLEELTMDLSVTVDFAEESADAEVGSGAMDTETDPSDKGTDDADTVEVNGSGGEDTETGNGSAEDLETQTMGTEDEPGSLSTGEEPDAEIDLDDKNQTGGEETQPGTTDAAEKEDSGSTETAERAADDEKAATETNKDLDKTSDESTSEKGKSGKDDTEDSTSEEATDSSEDTYTSDSSPKTGDPFPVQVILVMLSSLCALAGIAVRQLLKRNPEDA